jgi:hypothetical protein
MDDRQLFSRERLRLKPLRERIHDMDISGVLPLSPPVKTTALRKLRDVATEVVEAKRKGASIILMMGAHVLRAGVQHYLLDLMRRGYVSCIAMNGAGVIHDFELAFTGSTTESVARYIREGQFGLWSETGIINDVINRAYREDALSGYGAAAGRHIAESPYPHRSISVLAGAHRLGIPVTVHIGIGYDIIHEHPNFDAAAAGSLSYNDFLRFARVVENLEHGVVMNFGSAVMAPEVYLKALSMARNVARQEGREIRHFTTLVCDLVRLPSDTRKEPSRNEPCYYFRPLKTMLIRTVADGGKSFYVRGRHAATMSMLWHHINKQEEKRNG